MASIAYQALDELFANAINAVGFSGVVCTIVVGLTFTACVLKKMINRFW